MQYGIVMQGVYCQGFYLIGDNKHEAIRECNNKALNDIDDYHDWEVVEVFSNVDVVNDSKSRVIYSTDKTKEINKTKVVRHRLNRV